MSNPHRTHRAEARTPNRLAGELSVYLQQHACNPVDWWPWGPQAIDAARQADKPIFLSIGYSTCYWCHVMERECFENDAIARMMNDLFICIKVDREQRPDVDDLYMTGVQLMTGSGGWPMSMFLEPVTLKPFYGGTYFPPEDRYGRPGFPAVLHGVSNAWHTQREAIMQQAEHIAQAIRAQHELDTEPVTIDHTHVERAVRGLMSAYDAADAGFGPDDGPKFPQPANLDMLMATAWDQADVRNAVLHTLDRMAIGGMYDQIGGGFHRYSVDGQWRVPHFEKMLYDNAQLASTYARAYERTSDAFYARIAQHTLQYVLREMTSHDGAFFSAQDAEVNAREGGNYVWTQQQLRDALNDAGLGDDVPFALKVLAVDRGPNFRDPHHPDAEPVNVLLLPDRPERLAHMMQIDDALFEARFERVRDALLAVRTKRDQPVTDDKIIAGWNGLMIAAFADVGRVLKRNDFIHAAATAAEFVLARMTASDGALLRTHRHGESQIDAFLEDYAFVIRGLLALHRATDHSRWLHEAVKLVKAADMRFHDHAHGGWFDTRADQHDLFVRIKSVHDGAVPAGNSIMLLNLLDLHARTGESHWLDTATRALAGLSSAVANHPAGCVLSIIALHRVGATSAAQQGSVARDRHVDVRIEPQPNHWMSRERHEVIVRIRIADGWHINAAEAGAHWAAPLRIELIDGEGLTMTPAYPAGTPYRLADMPESETLRVLSGEVIVPLQFQRVGNVSTKPRLLIQYQACNDSACQAPQQAMLEL